MTRDSALGCKQGGRAGGTIGTMAAAIAGKDSYVTALRHARPCPVYKCARDPTIGETLPASTRKPGTALCVSRNPKRIVDQIAAAA